MILKPGDIRTEEDVADLASAGALRAASEKVALALASQGVWSSIIRLAPSVHGEGDYKWFIPILIAKARETGVLMHINDGLNRWTAVHLLDAARVYSWRSRKGRRSRSITLSWMSVYIFVTQLRGSESDLMFQLFRNHWKRDWNLLVSLIDQLLVRLLENT